MKHALLGMWMWLAWCEPLHAQTNPDWFPTSTSSIGVKWWEAVLIHMTPNQHRYLLYGAYREQDMGKPGMITAVGEEMRQLTSGEHTWITNSALGGLTMPGSSALGRLMMGARPAVQRVAAVGAVIGFGASVPEVYDDPMQAIPVIAGSLPFSPAPAAWLDAPPSAATIRASKIELEIDLKRNRAITWMSSAAAGDAYDANLLSRAPYGISSTTERMNQALFELAQPSQRVTVAKLQHILEAEVLRQTGNGLDEESAIVSVMEEIARHYGLNPHIRYLDPDDQAGWGVAYQTLRIGTTAEGTGDYFRRSFSQRQLFKDFLGGETCGVASEGNHGQWTHAFQVARAFMYLESQGFTHAQIRSWYGSFAKARPNSHNLSQIWLPDGDNFSSFGPSYWFMMNDQYTQTPMNPGFFNGPHCRASIMEWGPHN